MHCIRTYYIPRGGHIIGACFLYKYLKKIKIKSLVALNFFFFFFDVVYDVLQRRVIKWTRKNPMHNPTFFFSKKKTGHAIVPTYAHIYKKNETKYIESINMFMCIYIHICAIYNYTYCIVYTIVGRHYERVEKNRRFIHTLFLIFFFCLQICKKVNWYL